MQKKSLQKIPHHFMMKVEIEGINLNIIEAVYDKL
jgi:hypothetical protein